MKLYQTLGGQWCPTQATWFATMKEEGHHPFPDIADYVVEVPTTSKAELIEWLNFNRVRMPEVDNEELPSAPTTQPPSAIDWDEEFNALPILKQLHLAAWAMENARDALTKGGR